jgi:hypothetical protein
MKHTAFGVQMHSGWGVLVAVSGDAQVPEILARRRITVDSETPGANQPYHHAVRLELAEREKYLAKCVEDSSRMAAVAIRELVTELKRRDYQVVGCSVLLASGRPLPPLAKILVSHPLIHTAEGEFFRNTVCRACEDLRIPVTRIRERELDDQAKAAFGNAANRLQQRIAGLGSSMGPPWTKDHKATALAAALLLASTNTVGWTMTAKRP